MVDQQRGEKYQPSIVSIRSMATIRTMEVSPEFKILKA